MVGVKADVMEFLTSRKVKDGETVQYGWFVFQVAVKEGRTDLRTLDFKAMASFTDDFGAAEEINRDQMGVLLREGVSAGACTLRHAAMVSRSYVPGQEGVFLHRLDEAQQAKSGWFLGVMDDPLDVNDPGNVSFRSLYELTIGDMRFAPYWLLPVGYLIGFNGDVAQVRRR